MGEGARGRTGVRTYNSAVADAEGGAFELGTDGPKVILVGVDDSVTSMRAGAYAAGLARRQGARLVCVYVERPSAMYGAAAGAGAGAIAAQQQALDETAAALRREAEEGARRLGLALTFVVARGYPYTELRRVADEVRLGLGEQRGGGLDLLQADDVGFGLVQPLEQAGQPRLHRVHVPRR